MAGSLSLGGNTIATHTGPKGTGTVSLTTTQLNSMNVVKADTNTDPFGDSSQIRFYNFQDGAKDLMGNGDGTLFRTTTQSASIISSPAHPNHLTNEKVLCVDDRSYMSIAAIAITTFSVSFWVQANNFNRDNFVGIFGNQSVGQLAMQPKPGGGGSGDPPTLEVYVGSTDYFTSQQLANHTLHHIIYTANAGTTKLYLNNVDIGSAVATNGSGANVSLNSSNNQGETRLIIGNASTQLGIGTYGMNGFFRNIRIFNKQLSAAEVNTLYTGKL